MKFRYRLRTILATTAVFAMYLSLALNFGFGRALVCLLVFAMCVVAGVFLVSAWFCCQEENTPNALACILIAVMILVGSGIIALIVFQPVSLFESEFDASLRSSRAFLLMRYA